MSDACHGVETTAAAGLGANAIYNDLWDSLVLMTLFAVGFAIFRPEVLRYLFGPKIVTRTRSRREVEAEVPERAGAGPGGGDCSAGHFCFTEWAMAQSPEGSEVDGVLGSLGVCAVPSRGEAEQGDEGSGEGVEAADSLIESLAAGGDLDACWRAWRRLPGGSPLGPRTCGALAAALRAAPAGRDDVEGALEVAVASRSLPLAQAVLAAGSWQMSSAWLKRAGARLLSAGLGPLPESGLALARAYGRERSADLAVSLWRQACEERAGGDDGGMPGGVPAPELYGAALEACACCGEFGLALDLVRSAGWHAPAASPGQAALLKLARWLAQQQDVAQAHQCATSVRHAGGAVDAATLRSLMSACARNAKMDLASDFFMDVTGGGLSPDCATFSIMIRGYCAVGDVDRAVSFFRAMRRQGMVPETSTFDIILDSCACRNLPDLAEKVLSDMVSVGVRPSSATVAIMVRVHSARGDLARAAEVFRELPEKHGVEVDGRAYNAFVFACLSNGDVNLAMDTFEAMTRKGCFASARLYEALIEGCLRRGSLARAVGLVDEALGLAAIGAAAGAPGSDAGAPLPHRQVLLERRVVEDLLRLIGRRRQARSLGVPLAARLAAAGFEVSEDLLISLARAAEQGPAGELPSPSEARRAEWSRWRDYIAPASLPAAFS